MCRYFQETFLVFSTFVICLLSRGATAFSVNHGALQQLTIDRSQACNHKQKLQFLDFAEGSQKRLLSTTRLAATENGDDDGTAVPLRKRIKKLLSSPFRRLKKRFSGRTRTNGEIIDESSDSTTVTDTKEMTPPSVSVSSDDTTGITAKSEKPTKEETAIGDTNGGAKKIEAKQVVELSKPKVSIKTLPVGDRWAVSAPTVDLSGEWNLLVTDDFKTEYDQYLTLLGQPLLVRSIALSIVAMTSEETVQTDQGRSLFIRGRNVRGTWERTLTASGTDLDDKDDSGMTTTIVTADGEKVEAEAWWEDQGTVHRSWLRGVERYGGGAFESRRYLADNGKVLVCESIFHPSDTTREAAKVTWRFLKDGETL